jgi:hypothetical protein
MRTGLAELADGTRRVPATIELIPKADREVIAGLFLEWKRGNSCARRWLISVLFRYRSTYHASARFVLRARLACRP